MTHIDLSTINYHDPDQVLDKICLVSSHPYISEVSWEYDYNVNVQLQHLGWQNFNSLWKYSREPAIEKYTCLLHAIQLARTFYDQPGSLQLHGGEYSLLSDKLEHHIKSALAHVFKEQGYHYMDLKDVFPIIRENWVRLSEFKQAMISSLVNDSIKELRNGILHYFYLIQGKVHEANTRLWEAARRRWLDLDDMNPDPKDYVNIILDRFGLYEQMVMKHPSIV